jgi:hypothetical protein
VFLHINENSQEGTSIQKNSGDSLTQPITQEAQGIDNSRRGRGENEEKMEIAAEGDQKVLPENEKEPNIGDSFTLRYGSTL